MDRDIAVDLLDRLHAAQNEYYSGGSGAELEQLLAPASPGPFPATIASRGPTAGSRKCSDTSHDDVTSPLARSAWSDATSSPETGAGGRPHGRFREDRRPRPALVDRRPVRTGRWTRLSLLAAAARPGRVRRDLVRSSRRAAHCGPQPGSFVATTSTCSMLGSSMSSPTFSISACATFPERWAWRLTHPGRRRRCRRSTNRAGSRTRRSCPSPPRPGPGRLQGTTGLVLAPLLGLDSYQEALGDDAG